MKQEFNKDLLFEQYNFKVQDEFYKAHGATKIERIKFQGKGKDIQRNDIDVKLYFADGRIVTISEKRRKKDYDDILIELFHIYENGKREEGWIYKSMADAICYFMKTFVLTFTIKSLKKTYEEKIKLYICDKLNEFALDKTNRQEVIYIDGKKITLICANSINDFNKAQWVTFSIAIKPEDFFENKQYSKHTL